VECQYCHREYKDIEKHLKKCPSNPENEGKTPSPASEPVVVTPTDGNPAFKVILDGFGSELKTLKESIEKKKGVSPSSVYTTLIEFCSNNQANPKFKSLLEKCTDQRRHWRQIVIDTIDAMVAAGVI
jgi:hypothetical protein